jgi:hypothetical protein
MKPLKLMAVTLITAAFQFVAAQEIPVNYSLGEKYADRHKYSTVLSMERTDSDETVLVRTYYGGMPLRPKGHFIEIYNEDMTLKTNYNYKYAGENMVGGFVKNGQLNLLELVYDWKQEAYQYVVHQSSIVEFNFSKKGLLSIPSKEVMNPLAISKYHRDFKNGFTTAVHFNDEKTAFAITVHHRERKDEKYKVFLYDTSLNQRFKYDFSSQIAEKNYAFENIATSNDLNTVYLLGKAFFRKKRIGAKERKFQYELVKIDANGHDTQEFADEGRYPESLKPILINNELVAVGFYSDRKDNRYNGLAYFKMNSNTLGIVAKKYNAFSTQFMKDKFGRDVNAKIKNLIFKDVHITRNKDIVFSAEEYFVTSGDDISEGATKKVQRYHYNDIVCAKMDSNGEMLWARNINKAEVTQGDEAYASYTAFGQGNDMYFFINSGEHPQKIGKDRILFKQGFSRNPNVFVIKADTNGDLSYKKLIDDKEVRLPVMVSRPFIDKKDHELLFYAKRGNKKQLINVAFDKFKTKEAK